MNILFIKNLFIFILLILWQPSFAQTVDDPTLQKLLIENPSLIDDFS